MNDQFSQDPEKDLPNWLKEMRNRGSINNDESSPQEEQAPEQNEEDDISETFEKSSLPEEENEESDNIDEEQEPDWLKEIRLRHQQEIESIESEIPQLTDDDESVEEDSVLEDVSQQIDDPDLSGSTPLLEIPAQPNSVEESEEATSDDNAGFLAGDTQPIVIQAEEESSEVADEDFTDFLAEQESLEAASPSEEMESPEEGMKEDEVIDPEEGFDIEHRDIKTDELSEEITQDIDGEELEVGVSDSEEELIEEEVFELEESEEDLEPNLNSPDSHTLLEEVTDGDNPEAENDFGELTLDDPGDEAAESELEAEDELSAGEDENSVELLDWLAEEDEEEGEKASESTSSIDESDLTPAELPSWLAALKPSSEDNQEDLEIEDSEEDLDLAFELEDEHQEDIEGLGPLAGLKGIIPSEPEVLQQGRAKLRTGQLEFNTNQQRHVANLESVISNEGAPIEDHTKRIALPMRILQLLFAAILFISTLFPLITGSQIASRPVIGSIPESTAFYNQIELLPADVPVLVAFEVQPALYGEMKPLTSAVLDHLFEKQAHLVFISTLPTGPALIESLLSEELAHLPGVAARDYINLGYLSGGTAALRYFASNPRGATLLPQQWNNPILDNIKNISNFGIVLTITGDAEDARAWIEQVSPYTSDGIFSLASAQAGPLLLPYLNTDPLTIRSLVAGLKGAAYYESLRNQDGLGRQYWDAYSFGLGSIVILILLGGLYGRLIQIRPESGQMSQKGKASDE